MENEMMMAMTPDVAADEQAIRDVVQALVDAWNRGDSEAWSAQVGEDIRHTVWNGHYVEGREALTAGHAHIFSTFYKGTQQEYSMRWIRFLRPDVAAVQWDAHLVGRADSKARPLAIMVKGADGRWRVEIFQNTPVMERSARNA
ncbi:MAG: SgcJ/EcaC family oxidoreductase [Ardenticatenales bacterium]|nr:SgcJ/EcaC family oxidoreductase [Ardenticatenales bacterium]